MVHSLLDGLALTGALLAILVTITGAANMVVMAALWTLYFSLVSHVSVNIVHLHLKKQRLRGVNYFGIYTLTQC